jgi:tetratricopeptide (TPR) repeat protein
MSKRERDMAVRHLNKGVSLIERGYYEDAQHVLSEAEIHAKLSNAPEILASVLQTYADLLYSNGLENEALTRYYQVVDAITNSSTVPHMDKGQLAGMFSNMASILESKGNMQEARDKYRRSVAGYEDLLREDRSSKYVLKTISTLNNYGALLAEMGENDEAKKTFDKALLVMNKLGGNETDKSSQIFDRMIILENLLHAQNAETDFESMESKYTELIKIYKVMKEEKTSEEYHYNQKLASLLDGYAELLLENDETERAKDVLKELIVLLSTFSNGDNASNMCEMASALSSYAACLNKEDDLPAARNELEKAIHIIILLLESEIQDQKYINTAESILEDFVQLIDRENEEQIGIDDYNTILKLSELLSNTDPTNIPYKLSMAFSFNVRGKTLAEMERLDEASEDIIKGLGIAYEILETETSNPSYQSAVRSMITDLELIGKENESKEWIMKVNQLILSEGQTDVDNAPDDVNKAILFEENGIILAEKQDHKEALKNLQLAENIYSKIYNSDLKNEENKIRLQSILLKIGEIQSDIGEKEESFDTYLRLFRMQPSQDNAGNLENILDMIVIDLAETEKNKELVEKYTETLSFYEELIGTFPENQQYSLKKLNLKENLANLLLEIGEPERALDIYFELLENDRTNSYYRSKVSRTLDKFKADIITQGNVDGMIDDYRILLKKYDRVIELDPANIPTLIGKAETLEKVASLMEKDGVLENAAVNYKLASRAYRDLLKLEPANKSHLNNVAKTSAHLAALLAEMGETADAHGYYDVSLQIYEQLSEEDASNFSYQQSIAHVLGNIGYTFLEEEKIEAAKTVYEKALRVYAGLLDIEPENKFYLENVAATMNNLGYILDKLGRRDDADWMYEKARSLSGN